MRGMTFTWSNKRIISVEYFDDYQEYLESTQATETTCVVGIWDDDMLFPIREHNAKLMASLPKLLLKMKPYQSRHTLSLKAAVSPPAENDKKGEIEQTHEQKYVGLDRALEIAARALDIIKEKPFKRDNLPMW